MGRPPGHAAGGPHQTWCLVEHEVLGAIGPHDVGREPVAPGRVGHADPLGQDHAAPESGGERIGRGPVEDTAVEHGTADDDGEDGEHDLPIPLVRLTASRFGSRFLLVRNALGRATQVSRCDTLTPSRLTGDLGNRAGLALAGHEDKLLGPDDRRKPDGQGGKEIARPARGPRIMFQPRTKLATKSVTKFRGCSKARGTSALEQPPRYQIAHQIG